MNTTLREALKQINIRQNAAGDPVTIGSVTDHAEFGPDGSFRLRGTSSTWRDLVGNLIGAKLSVNAGTVDYDWQENALRFQSGGSIDDPNDRVQWNQEINHEFKVGTSITFGNHLHWFQDNTTPYTFTLRYRLQRNGYPKTTTWTDINLTTGSTTDIFTYTSGTLCQITSFPEITLDCGLSDTLQFMLARTDSELGDVVVYFADCHAEIDSTGSEDTFVKVL